MFHSKACVNGTLIMNDVFMLVNTAVDGAGLIYTTEGSISDKLESGKLEAVLKPYAATSTGFYLYYPQRSQVLPKLRAFIDHIREANETNLLPP
jgi:DNA-binding transcriptional LysR family regulator